MQPKELNQPRSELGMLPPVALLFHSLSVRTQIPTPGSAPEVSHHTLGLCLRLGVKGQFRGGLGFARKVA